MTTSEQSEVGERIERARRTKQRHLNLRDLGLEELPPSLWTLTDLRTLDLGFNRLSDLPVEISRLRLLVELVVSFNRLTSLPEAIGELSRLQALLVLGNQLSNVPESLIRLTNLRALDVSANALTRLPDDIGKLRNLTTLGASNNQLRALPEALRNHPSLTYLYLGGNKLGLPPELLSGYQAAAILDYYFRKRTSRPLNEAKMILVGRGGAGKTSLVNRLARGTFDSRERKTDGIAITTWPIRLGNDDVRLNVWDFGGQEIMHATHQFFLTKRSLYLVVVNAREGDQDGNVDYWLRLVESFGAESPVLVVVNKIHEHPLELNRRGLQAKFPTIRGFYETDCDAGTGIAELKQAILQETDRLEHLRDPFPAAWFTVKGILADLPKTEQQSFISFSRYQQLCKENGVDTATSQETLVGFLHDLGIVVNFRDDPRLAETHVLDPDWVTNGIYRILNAPALANRKGELHVDDLAGILDGSRYPRQMHLYLLDLMRKFELCYEFYDNAGNYLIPELLGKEEPNLSEFAAPDALRFELHYDIVPEGLVPRFIVRSRALNRDLPRWRSGVVLQWDGNRAVVRGDLQDKRILISVIGPLAGRRRLLSVIRADLQQIHRSVAKLHAVERVPVPQHQGLVVDYENLVVLEAEAEAELKLVHGGRVIKVDVPALLNGVEEGAAALRQPPRELGEREAVRVAFSYSHRDEELHDQLETHLKLLQRQGIIGTWHDRRILPGDKWASTIDDNFKRADLVLLLVSADLLASDYGYEVEMRDALAREARGETKVVPVIVRACDWTGAPFAKLQALPKDGRPVASWPNRDEAWIDVAKGIRKLAEEIRTRRRL